jgi:outer membrane protein assembly factor BamE (lipoprotein component of BamABCDE complex)
MERKCLHSALPLRSASLLLVGLLAAALAGGCAVQKTIVYEGRAFPVERIVGIDAAFRDGLDRDAVRGLLGAPYATGSDADGQAFWLYRYRGQSTTSGGGGIGIVGVVASQAATGGEIRLVFDAAGRVRQVVWEIAGPEAYRTLAAGGAR